MYIFLMMVHVIVCVVLILVVLLQAGRGGGMSDMMGGGQPSTLFGTQTNAFMTRATEVCAVLFLVTSLSLGIISTQRGKSVMEKRRFTEALKTSLPAIPPPETGGGTIPAAESTKAPAQATAVETPPRPEPVVEVVEATQTKTETAAVPSQP